MANIVGFFCIYNVFKGKAYSDSTGQGFRSVNKAGALVYFGHICSSYFSLSTVWEVTKIACKMKDHPLVIPLTLPCLQLPKSSIISPSRTTQTFGVQALAWLCLTLFLKQCPIH